MLSENKRRAFTPAPMLACVCSSGSLPPSLLVYIPHLPPSPVIDRQTATIAMTPAYRIIDTTIAPCHSTAGLASGSHSQSSRGCFGSSTSSSLSVPALTPTRETKRNASASSLSTRDRSGAQAKDGSNSPRALRSFKLLHLAFPCRIGIQPSLRTQCPRSSTAKRARSLRG